MKQVKTVVALSAVAIGLVGCATNPYTGERQTSDTAKGAGAGALVGAGAGALIGAASGNAGLGAVIGAGSGALVGGGIGYYMDQENAKLRQELVGTGVQVQKNADGSVSLIMSSDVTFATNSADINSGFYPTLNSVAKVLKEYNKTNVIVSGYTDNTGSAAYNQSLSERRASSVSNYLAAQGVSGNRLFSQGFGERNPIASNATASGRSANRRVEIVLRPKG